MVTKWQTEEERGIEITAMKAIFFQSSLTTSHNVIPVLTIQISDLTNESALRRIAHNELKQVPLHVQLYLLPCSPRHHLLLCFLPFVARLFQQDKLLARPSLFPSLQHPGEEPPFSEKEKKNSTPIQSNKVQVTLVCEGLEGKFLWLLVQQPASPQLRLQHALNYVLRPKIT